MSKYFGKRGISLLTTIALLVSMVSMLSGLMVVANAEDHEPRRVMSYTSTAENPGGKIVITNAADAVCAGTTVTVKGYYKVTGFTKTADLGYLYVTTGTATNSPKFVSYNDTSGWVYFEFENYVASNDADPGWIQFGLTNAYGTVSVADVTMEDAEGNVLSEPIVGSRDYEGWKELIDSLMA